MKLASFSVSDFRSITTAKKVSLQDYSVLVGANNEGKSNILHALAMAMETIEDFKNSLRRDRLGRVFRAGPGFPGARPRYEWSRDFPISKQKSSNKNDYTEIILDFALSNNEIEAFQLEIGSKLNGTLPISIKYSAKEPNVTISKQGPGGTALTSEATRVAEFVSKRVNFDYIPAIRTSTSAEEVISELVTKELAKLENHQEYKNALDKIAELQDPLLKSLSDSIKETVSSFLPSVRSVNIELPRDARYRAFRRGVSIEIDDGNNTSLERKGDGVKSLVALALMRHASTVAEGAETTIIAIEEPEAHLHPHAIHQVREVLVGLSNNNQVIISSHSPLFVNPANLCSTIVVQRNKAAPAKTIAEVREVLGVRLSDNLQSARLVAIVEGPNDIICLKAILQKRFAKLEAAIKHRDIVFDELGGASNLSYKIRTYRSSASMIQCFLDNDDAGIKAVRNAESDGVIKIADYNLFRIEGSSESELEDLFDPHVYKKEFQLEFGVDPTTKPRDTKGKKWSISMQRNFEAHGKHWDKQQEINVKRWLAEFVSTNVDKVIIEARFAPVNAFAGSLMQKLEL